VAVLVAGAFAVGGLGGYFLKASSATQATIHPTTAAEAVGLPDYAQPLKPGPWGNMEYQPMSIQPPDEYLPVQALEQADLNWHGSRLGD
jgi:hypothetical protein